MTLSKTWIRCLLISLGLHLSLLLYLYTHPIFFASSLKSFFGFSSPTPEWLEHPPEAITEELALREAFDHIFLQPSALQQPLDHLELPTKSPLSPQLEVASTPDLPFDVEMVWVDETHTSAPPLLIEQEQETPLSLSTPPLEPLLPSSPQEPSQVAIALPSLDEELAPHEPETDLLGLEPLQIEALLEPESLSHGALSVSFDDVATTLHSLKSSSKLQLQQMEITPVTPKEERLQLSDFHTFSSHTPIAATRPVMPHQVPANIDIYALPPLATAVEWSDEFDTQLHFASIEDRPGYIFTLQLQPHIDVSRYGLKQNIHFIIDRSHSIQKHRFAVFKRAIIKALSSMQAGDTFNIYLVDKKIVKFSPSVVRVNKKAIDAAESFLEQQQIGSLFSEANVYASLDKLLADISSAPHDVHTAIFLTDGNALKDPLKHQKDLNQWIDKNSSRVSLYTAAVGQKNCTLMLDMLSSLSGGHFLYSDTHASFPRKLAKLILDLKNPLIKELMISARPHRNNAHLEFYPSSHQLPHLYGNQPYVLHGYIDKPCSFDLILQGKNGEEWITVNKSFTFGKQEKNPAQFEKEWQTSQTHLYYRRFLKEGKISYLDEAKNLLNQSHRELTYE